jgi:hypothetical protein
MRARGGVAGLDEGVEPVRQGLRLEEGADELEVRVDKVPRVGPRAGDGLPLVPGEARQTGCHAWSTHEWQPEECSATHAVPPTAAAAVLRSMLSQDPAALVSAASFDAVASCSSFRFEVDDALGCEGVPAAALELQREARETPVRLEKRSWASVACLMYWSAVLEKVPGFRPR